MDPLRQAESFDETGSASATRNAPSAETVAATVGYLQLSGAAYDFVHVSLTVTIRPLVSVNDDVIVFLVSLSIT